MTATQRTFRNRLMAASIVLLSAPCAALTSHAEEFRVESKVYADNSQTPAVESTTLFADSRVYGFQTTPYEITLFDIPRNRIILLDPERKVRTELLTDELAAFVEQVRVHASQQSDALQKFAAEPKFDETKEDNGWIKFASPLITYRVRAAKPDNAAVVPAYRNYSDWAARLITMVHPGSLPPFPSLAINAAMEREGLVPEEVERTIITQGRLGKKPSVMRSEHAIEYHLSGTDRKRIEEVGQYLVTFPKVSLEQYLRPIEQAKR